MFPISINIDMTPNFINADMSWRFIPRICFILFMEICLGDLFHEYVSISIHGNMSWKFINTDMFPISINVDTTSISIT